MGTAMVEKFLLLIYDFFHHLADCGFPLFDTADDSLGNLDLLPQVVRGFSREVSAVCENFSAVGTYPEFRKTSV